MKLNFDFLKKLKPCPTCKGSGLVVINDNDIETCPECNGDKVVTTSEQ